MSLPVLDVLDLAGGGRIVNSPDPSAPQDAATKAYVDQPRAPYFATNLGVHFDVRLLRAAVAATAGSPVLTCTGGLFSPADAGRVAYLYLGGTTFLATTVASVQSATQLTLAASAPVSAAAADLILGTDVTAALNSALQTVATASDFGILELPAAKGIVTGTVTVPGNVVLRGQGRLRTSLFIPGALFAGTPVVQIGGDNAVVERLGFGSGGLAATDPAVVADLVRVQHDRVNLREIDFGRGTTLGSMVFYSDSVQCQDSMLSRLTGTSRAGSTSPAIRTPNNGTVNSTKVFNNEHVISDCILHGPAGTYAILIDGTHDVMLTGIVTGGTGGALWIRGQAASVSVVGCDVGNGLLIEANGTDIPRNVTFSSCVFVSGQTLAPAITAGRWITFAACNFLLQNGTGLSISGSADFISFTGCTWNQGNMGNVTAPVYDVKVASGPHATFVGCHLGTPPGNGPGLVTASIDCGALPNNTVVAGCRLVAGYGPNPPSTRLADGIDNVLGSGSHLAFRRDGTALPTPAAGADAGGAPPAPLVGTLGGDSVGTLSFGTGTGPVAGEMVTLAFARPFPGGIGPQVFLTPANAATAALGVPYVTYKGSIAAISVPNAPAASQSNTTYAYRYLVVGMGG